jgi:hypothetical protein
MVPIERTFSANGHDGKGKAFGHAKQNTKIATSPDDSGVQQQRSKTVYDQIYQRILKKQSSHKLMCSHV